MLASFGFLGNTLAMPNSHDDVDLTIRMPSPLFERASSIATLEGLNIHDLIVRAVRHEIEEISARAFASSLDGLISQDSNILRRLGEQ